MDAVVLAKKLIPLPLPTIFSILVSFVTGLVNIFIFVAVLPNMAALLPLILRLPSMVKCSLGFVLDIPTYPLDATRILSVFFV